jgi:colanic acid biosynthesis glycosyl transferase WcaI
MRLLVICPHYEPDVAPTGVVMSAICSELVDAGHELHVVTSLPWYEHHRVEPEWGGRLVRSENHSWGRISRVHPFPTDKRNIPARSMAFVGFTGLATLVALFRRARPDGVLAMSPPITLGLAGALVARIRRVPFVFNIQDVFPDVAIEVNAISSPRLIRLARWLERFTYRRSGAVTVLSDDLRDNVVAKIGAGSRTRVRVIPNFVDTRGIRPAPRDNSYRAEFGLGDRTVVMYAGNVGFSQSLHLMVDAARELRGRDDIIFVVNGGGSGRPAVEKSARGLPNVRFVDFQPRERLAEVLAAADVHIIALRRGLAHASVPSKLYSILAAGRPVLASVDPGTEVARVIERAGSGRAVPPDDGPAFTAALVEMLDDELAREAMGRQGRAFVETWVSPAGVASAYSELFAELRS